jgi:pullulanase
MKQSTFTAIFALLLFAQPTFCQDKIMKEKSDYRDSTFTEILNSVNNFPNYNGNDLGLTYSKKKSVFKVWSPPAKSVNLYLYEKGVEGPLIAKKQMKKDANGVWSLKQKGDLEGKFYTFQVELADSTLAETPDPYAVATGVNGKRAMVVDLSKTNPKGWDQDARPPLKNFSDIVLYELHFRDISVHKNSGIEHKGKFLGLAETGTATPDGLSTGLDHIKELGVTHVHLLPSYDFMSIDEMLLPLNRYNWGYDPQNYNVPEGSYSTDPFDGRVRIKEFKQLIKTLHENGLRVIMDVVYNHTGATEESVFNQLVPFYYYRTYGFIWSNASACGNETASERYMMRKFMIESMKYWAEEYHVDGFRVDLMGIHDIETMNLISQELHKIDPTIFIYGEGWAAGKSTLPESKRALKENAKQLKGIALFSDEVRDGIKGHVFTPNAKGFVSGENDLEESVKFGIVGAVQHPQVDYEKVNYSKAAWANEPTQCINYASCHDNHTLWDRLQLSCANEDEATLLKIDKLAQTIVLTSQGIPFLHAGEEFVRSKSLVENSFQSPDRINQIDWDNKSKYSDLFNYYKTLIQLRKEHPAFKMGHAEAVQKHLSFLDLKQDNLIGYTLNGAAVGDKWKRILVIFNGQKVGKQVDIPKGDWKIICHNYRINLEGMGKNPTESANLMPFSAYILAEE